MKPVKPRVKPRLLIAFASGVSAYDGWNVILPKKVLTFHRYNDAIKVANEYARKGKSQ